MSRDPRIPVRFVSHAPATALPPPGAGEALLLPHGTLASRRAALMREGWAVVRELPEVSPGQHPPACRCCAGNPPAGLAMLALFQARARGEVGFFRRVTASLPLAERTLLARLVASDPLVSACFMLAA